MIQVRIINAKTIQWKITGEDDIHPVSPDGLLTVKGNSTFTI